MKTEITLVDAVGRTLEHAVFFGSRAHLVLMFVGETFIGWRVTAGNEDHLTPETRAHRALPEQTIMSA